MTKKLTIFLLLSVLGIEILIVLPRPVNLPRSAQAEVISKNRVDQGLGAQQIVSGVHLVEASVSGKEWELWASQAMGFKDGEAWNLEKVKVRFYGKDGTHYTVHGDVGKVQVEKKDIEIVGNVETRSSNGYIFKTARVSYSSIQKLLLSPQSVYMRSLKGNKLGELKLSAGQMSANLENNLIVLTRSVRGSRVLGDGQILNLRSEVAEFSGRNNSAVFSSAVVVDTGTSRITGPRAHFIYDPSSKNLSSVLVDGGARLSDLSRWATADQVEVHFLKDEVHLTGAPRVVQNSNELRGEEIVLSQRGQEIFVKKARAKFDPSEGKKGDSGE